MRKKFLLSCFLIIFCLILTACSSKTNSSSEDSSSGASITGSGVKIVLSISNGSDTYRASLTNAVTNAAENAGMTIEVLDAKGSTESQMNHIKNATDADVIICALCDRNTAQQMEVLAGNKPIVFINSCPDEDYLESDKYIFVGSDEKVAGKLQAEYLLNKFSSKDSLNVVLIKGMNTHSATKGRTNSVKKTLEASGKKINYIFEDYSNWDTESAETMFDLILKTKQPIDAVICNNDSMALGIIKSVEKNHLDPSKIPILGVDATTYGLASIEKGTLACTIYQSAIGQGESAIQAAAALVNGTNISSIPEADPSGMYVWIPFEQVTIDNIDNYR